MSLLDKAKAFLGDHGVTVRHVQLADRPVAEARLALTDGGLRGTFAVLSDKPCTILARRTELVLEITHPDGRAEQVIIARQLAPTEDDETPRDAPIKYPYELGAGHEIVDELDLVFDGSIEALLVLRRLTVGRGVRFYLRTLVDVAGSPFDPEAVDVLELHLGE